jgi:N,N-dimethylformamidase beta subunit-like protein
MRGIYAGFGGYAQRSGRGFQVFRQDHWALEGTGLSYADMFGDEANIFSYEVDGLDYTFVDGLPVATFTDGAPEGIEIIAMNFATLAETGLPEYAYTRMYGDGDAQFRASMMVDNPTPADVSRFSRGTGMVVNFQRGKGEVFTAGACEWINGLRLGEFYTETITKNVLARFCA